MFNHSMWIIRSTRNDSLVERPLQHQLLSTELSCPGGILHTFQSGTERGCLKPKFLPSCGPGIILYKPVSALAAQNVAPCWQNQGHQGTGYRNAGSQILPQTYLNPHLHFNKIRKWVQHMKVWEAQNCVYSLAWVGETVSFFLRSLSLAVKRVEMEVQQAGRAVG